MACNQIQHHFDSLCVGLFYKFDHVVVRAEARIDAVKVNDIVAAVNPS